MHSSLTSTPSFEPTRESCMDTSELILMDQGAERHKKLFYANINLVYDVLSSVLEVLGRNLPSLEESVLSRAILRVSEQVENASDRGDLVRIGLDLDLLNVGRYARLIKTNLLTTLHYKTASFFFTTCQILTNMGDLTKFDVESQPKIFLLLALVASLLRITNEILNDVETLYYIQLHEANKKATENTVKNLSKNRSKNNFSKKELSTSPIWTEEIIDMRKILSDNKFSSADLSSLLLRLLPMYCTPDERYNNVFFMACPFFSTTHLLFDYLFEMFRVPKKGKVTEHRTAIRQHVLSAMLKWLKQNYYLVDFHLEENLFQFIDKYRPKLKDSPSFEEQFNLLEAEIKRTDLFDLPLRGWGSWPPSKVPVYEIKPCELVSLFQEETIASQLSLIEFEIYSRIKSIELLNQAWNKPKLQCNARNVVELIRRANSVSFWIATTIVLQPKVKDRARVISSFITIAKHLRDLNNFNTLVGIVAGMNTSAISRLKSTWTNVKAKDLEVFKELQDLMNPTKSFSRLRAATAESSTSKLPYLGMALSDLTFIDEGNRDEVEDKGHPEREKLINIEKHHMVYRAIEELLRFQKNNDFGKISKKDPLFTFLFELPVLHEEDLYKLSLDREPRDS